MSASFINASFVDELIKIAATMKILRQAARRLKPIKHLPGPLNMMPAFQVPTKRQTAAAMKMVAEPSHMSAAMENIPEVVKKNISKNMADYKPGSLVVASPNRIGEMLSIRSPRLRRDIRTNMVIHEGLERAAPSYDPKDLHGNLKVLMDERNLLNTLTGEGSRGVRKFMGDLRAPEFDLQDKRLLETFKDPRVLEFTKPGHKIPKAMKRSLLRRQQAPMTDDEARNTVSQQGKFMLARNAASQQDNLRLKRMLGDVENSKVISGIFDKGRAKIAATRRDGVMRLRAGGEERKEDEFLRRLGWVDTGHPSRRIYKLPNATVWRLDDARDAATRR